MSHYCHLQGMQLGGFDFLVKEVRTAVLAYPDVVEPRNTSDDRDGLWRVSGEAEPRGHFNKSLLVSCLMDAVEHDQEKVEVRGRGGGEGGGRGEGRGKKKVEEVERGWR